MRRLRSRRTLLTSLVGLSLGTAGCFGGTLTESDDSLDSGVVPADAFDCDEVDRPDPPTPDRDGALDPVSYPDLPAELLESALEYVREFEAAFRRNTFIEEYGSETAEFDIEFETWDTERVGSESDRAAVLVAVVYNLTTKTRLNDEDPERYTRVTYYVDENVALRARYDGIAQDASIEPDPRSAGELVACFE